MLICLLFILERRLAQRHKTKNEAWVLSQNLCYWKSATIEPQLFSNEQLTQRVSAVYNFLFRIVGMCSHTTSYFRPLFTCLQGFKTNIISLQKKASEHPHATLGSGNAMPRFHESVSVGWKRRCTQRSERTKHDRLPQSGQHLLGARKTPALAAVVAILVRNEKDTS